MNRNFCLPQHLLKPIMLASIAITIVVAALASSSKTTSAAGTGACYINAAGYSVYLAHNTLEECARAVRASKGWSQEYGIGSWAGFVIAIDGAGNLYSQDPNSGEWYYEGLVHNYDGSTGSLWDRCFAGDIQACNRLYGNYDSAIDQWDYLYPEGWFR